MGEGEKILEEVLKPHSPSVFCTLLWQQMDVSSNSSYWPVSKPQITSSIWQHEGASKEVVPAHSPGLQHSMPQSKAEAKAQIPMRFRARTAMIKM